MPRLRALADKYDFLLIVDDTIGNFVNVDVLPYADIVVSSLSKIFSGSGNAMGGRYVDHILNAFHFIDNYAYSLVLNPRGRRYTALKETIAAQYEDTYFSEDALFMERNSRDIARRVRVIDENAQAICAFLRSRSLAQNVARPEGIVIKELYYPKYTTPANYLRCRTSEGGYGGLFSIIFTSLAASEAFFDTLSCLKGPSLGTNFTLACPYTILAHYDEMDWASQYGVEQSLVRISVGMEEREMILQCFKDALAAAEPVALADDPKL